jgi:GDP/UDP-N,N'-diacetylbacillosamine 2-epimerase (hydrolysing)
MYKKKICVVTGTRAEYGLLYWFMKHIKNDKNLKLQLIVTGMHLVPEFGNTINQILQDKFKVDRKIKMLLPGDTPVHIAKSVGIGMMKFADALKDLKPDLLVVLGDRFELISATYPALIARIPVAHFHGGEATEGLIDEATRHSITKMSHLHFVANKVYKKRVIQLGENPKNVFNVGGTGIDNINKLKLLSKKQMESNLKIKFKKKNLIATFHPVTLEASTAKKQFNELLKAFKKNKDINIIFTKPNADTDGRTIIKQIEKFVKENKSRSCCFTSLGQLNYLSLLKYVDGVIGNSSSGLLEVPTFKKGTINIGDRQRGRLKASSVIDCDAKERLITKAINTLYSSNFQKKIKKTINPNGTGGASEKAYRIIKKISLKKLIKKSFYNIGY